MKKLVLYTVLFLTACTAKNPKNMDSFLEIDFQDFFKNDTVSLSINQYSIFKDKTINIFAYPVK